MVVRSNEFGDESREMRSLLLSSLGSDEKLERMEARYRTACPVVTTTKVGDLRIRETYQSTSQGIPL
jgi:hypothetical protein